jgi:hypothetical protein
MVAQQQLRQRQRVSPQQKIRGAGISRLVEKRPEVLTQEQIESRQRAEQERQRQEEIKKETEKIDKQLGNIEGEIAKINEKRKIITKDGTIDRGEMSTWKELDKEQNALEKERRALRKFEGKVKAGEYTASSVISYASGIGRAYLEKKQQQEATKKELVGAIGKQAYEKLRVGELKAEELTATQLKALERRGYVKQAPRIKEEKRGVMILESGDPIIRAKQRESGRGEVGKIGAGVAYVSDPFRQMSVPTKDLSGAIYEKGKLVYVSDPFLKMSRPATEFEKALGTPIYGKPSVDVRDPKDFLESAKGKLEQMKESLSAKKREEVTKKTREFYKTTYGERNILGMEVEELQEKYKQSEKLIKDIESLNESI